MYLLLNEAGTQDFTCRRDRREGAAKEPSDYVLGTMLRKLMISRNAKIIVIIIQREKDSCFWLWD